jgi:ABC-2 type transport system permease protein
MTLFKYELKQNLKQTLIWFAILSVILLVASFEFKVYQGDEEIQAAMATFEPFFKALGMAGVDFTTAIGFIGVFSLYIYLPLAFFSGLLGLNILSKEHHKHTSEFLLTMPIKRSTIVTSKGLVMVIYSILLNVMLHVTMYFIYSQYDSSRAFLQFVSNLSLGVLLIQFIFMSIGFALSILINNRKHLNGLFIAIILSTFMINMLVGYLEESYFLPYLSPFQYYTAKKMMDGVFELNYLILTLLLIVLPIIITYYHYPKKNIKL